MYPDLQLSTNLYIFLVVNVQHLAEKEFFSILNLKKQKKKTTLDDLLEA